MNYSHIVACTPSGIIGVDNTLPWYYPDDLKFFKNKTEGSVVIMGSNTYKSIGKPLPNRINVVLSSNPQQFEKDLIFYATTIKTIEALITRCNEANTNVFIVGGGQMYKHFNQPKEIYITKVPEINTDKPCVKYEQNLKTYTLLTSNQSKELTFEHYALLSS